jgi:hypothetical protein
MICNLEQTVINGHGGSLACFTHTTTNQHKMAFLLISFLGWLSCLSRVSSTSAHSSSIIHSSSSSSSLSALIVTVRPKEEPLPSSEPLLLLSHPHLIYNRGLDDFPSEYRSVVELSGIGKEFFIFLKHIAFNYHKLPHLLIFGRYSAFLPHSNCTTISLVMSSQKLSFENDGFAYVGEGCLEMKVQELPNAHEEITKFLGSDHVIKHPKYVAGSLFAVTREAVLRNPLSFYQDLARRVASEDYSQHGEVPILIDRLWPVIFRSKCAAGGEFDCIYRAPSL